MSYQTEERYWTDYLRIALPIAGLLLLLMVFWYWASSFIGDDDDNNPQTPVAAVVNTPITAATLTPTLQDAVQVPQETVQPTPQPTQGTAPPTATTEISVDPTQDTGEATGGFVEGDLVVVNDDNVRMRSEPTTATENIVEELTQGTELRILSSIPAEAEGYVWWNVSDEINQVEGWVVQDFLDS